MNDVCNDINCIPLIWMVYVKYINSISLIWMVYVMTFAVGLTFSHEYTFLQC